MSTFSPSWCRRLVLAVLVTLCGLGGAWGGPGAHGPNGEHLDGTGSGPVAVADAPRLETFSDAFELVAVLTAHELSILVDRYATNEPLLGATLELESGGRKAVAQFRADLGDYAVADEAFLKALRAPGEHALVITLKAGDEADLLDGVLRVAAPARDDHAHAPSVRWTWGIGAAVLLAVVLAALWWRQRSRIRAAGAAA